jgi:hypothetical protein
VRVPLGRLVDALIIELIGTWLLVGFVSAIGWNVADETVNKPYVDPYLSKKMATDTTRVDTNVSPPTSQDK